MGPYRQSERGEIYKEMADKLVASGHAYPCFCTEEELAAKREQVPIRQACATAERHRCGKCSVAHLKSKPGGVRPLQHRDTPRGAFHGRRARLHFMLPTLSLKRHVLPVVGINSLW